jgi:hypothetical protein
MMGKRFDAKLCPKSPFDSNNRRVNGDYSDVADPTEEVKDFLAEYSEALAGKKSSVSFQ